MAIRRSIGWFFMLPEDVASFGARVEAAHHGVLWRSTHGGVVDHPDLLSALDAASLVAITAPTAAAPPIWLTGPHLLDGMTLRAGSLAHAVDRDELGPGERQTFDDLLA